MYRNEVVPIWMFGVSLPFQVWAIFSTFAKIVEIIKKILIKPQIGTRIQGSTSYEPLTTFLRRTMRSEQVSKNVKKLKK